MLIAVATKDGISINQHFGHAKRFQIYQIQEGRAVLKDERDVDLYCLGGSSDQSAMAGILKTIADCHSVLVAKIGDGPAQKLARIGVTSVADYAYEEIHASVAAYALSLADSESAGGNQVSLQPDSAQLVYVRNWVKQHGLDPIENDCATAVMLKVLDGKCKMSEQEKRVMRVLYQATLAFPGAVLSADLHDLIHDAVGTGASDTHLLHEDLILKIYEARLLAETRISRPVMKTFKARIRQLGLFAGFPHQTEYSLPTESEVQHVG